VQADMHCVTTWSRLDQKWEGIPFAKIIELAKPKSDTKFVIAHSEYGFTANTPLEFCMRDDCLIAIRANGEPLSAEHGSPARLVVPRLYAWKSAKWLRGIEFSDVDKPGFWERMATTTPAIRGKSSATGATSELGRSPLRGFHRVVVRAEEADDLCLIDRR
jgi:DMSO/TMAO reductase YedYZ molybdopterin-dependent catalytic subunit